MNETVVVADLVKRYRRTARLAVDGLSFSVRPGEVFGLLGPNGAGKTTTVGVLTTRVLPTGGTALVNGIDVVANPRRARQILAMVPQRNNLDRALNIRQNLLFHALYHGVGRAERRRRADEILDRMGLADRADSRIDFISGGQAQRIMIARALMHRPKVLFLDEPSTGLDPQARLFVHERITELRSEGVTIVLTTHDMDEAAKLSDRVGIVDHGQLLALDTPENLTRELPGSTTLTLSMRFGGADPEKVNSVLSDVDGVQRVEQITSSATGLPPDMPTGIPGGMPTSGPPPGLTPPTSSSGRRSEGQFRLYTESEPAVVLPKTLRVLSDLRCEVTDLSIGKPSLEDVFIRMTGRELR